MVVSALTLTLPTLAHADEYDSEMRLLDLELENIYLRQHAIDAEMRAASRERAAAYQEFEDGIPAELDHPRTACGR